jgi:hypothetical protein
MAWRTIAGERGGEEGRQTISALRSRTGVSMMEERES